VSTGRSNQDVADQLHISPETAGAHTERRRQPSPARTLNRRFDRSIGLDPSTGGASRSFEAPTRPLVSSWMDE
jgi:hypothetical protein